ncbi:MAG: dephospho-CoA kinase [Bacteroidota bacterium]|nr:dephospho-CoA kinase [Bacteroidota bacterium]
MNTSRKHARASRRPYFLVGLTGGYGAGKSTVASMLADRFPVIDSDLVAKQIVETDQKVRSAIRKEFGDNAFLSDGSIDRSYIASIVFQNPEKLNCLNAVVHPPTVEKIFELAEREAKRGNFIVIVESALIYETGLERLFDIVLAVVAAQTVVERRLAATRGESIAAVRSRYANQWSPAEKQAKADFSIINEGSFDTLAHATRFVAACIISIARRHGYFHT